MGEIIPFYKPLGMTMGEVIIQARKLRQELNEAKLSFMGRLDPMASGLVLVAVNADAQERRDYLQLPKTYQFAIWFGIATDSLDVLGKVVKTDFLQMKEEVEAQLPEALTRMTGKREQLYPWYSAKPVQGKPLWQWAREGRQTEIERPSKTIEILSLKPLSPLKEIPVDEIVVKAMGKIEKVKGDFRQQEIMQSWRELAEKEEAQTVLSKEFEVTGSSGLYVRGLAEELGQAVALPALCGKILRTRMGTYPLSRAHALPIE